MGRITSYTSCGRSRKCQLLAGKPCMSKLSLNHQGREAPIGADELLQLVQPNTRQAALSVLSDPEFMSNFHDLGLSDSEFHVRLFTTKSCRTPGILFHCLEWSHPTKTGKFSQHLTDNSLSQIYLPSKSAPS